MKTILVELMAYTVWANRQITQTILSVSPELWNKVVDSSFPTLHKTLLHIWDADAIWWQRLEKKNSLRIPSAYFTGDIPELVAELLAQEDKWLQFVVQADEGVIGGGFSYKNGKGDEFSQPLYQVILHVCNHGTYHRGQLVTMLRALGLEALPQTDFVHWARKMNQ